MRASRWVHLVAPVAVLVGIELLLSACGVASRGSATQEVSRAAASTGSLTAAANRRAAHREAHLLLGKAVLPAGAMRVWSEPVGDSGALARPPQVPSLADLVDVHGWWRLASTERSAYRFIKAHLPHGARLDGWGVWGRQHPGPASAFVDFALPPVKGVFQARDLDITVARTGRHSVGVRVDSQIIWTVPKPASERVPSSVQAVRITRERLGRLPRVTATVTSAVGVHRLVALLNGLPIEQPGSVLSCPVMPPQPSITISFLSPSDASAIATATYTGPCGGTQFRIHGRTQHPLDGVFTVVRAAQRLTGMKLIPHPYRI